MQITGVLLVAVCIIGFTNAELSLCPVTNLLGIKIENCQTPTNGPNCTNFPTFKHLHYCCYKIDNTTPSTKAVESCLTKYEDQPNPEICASACAFEKSTVGDRDGHVNYTALHCLLEKATTDPVVVEFMMGTIKDCEDKAIEMVKKPPYSNEAGACNCNSRAYLIRRCAANSGTLKCPVDSWREGSYCNQVRQDAEYCQTQDKDLININIALRI